MQTNCARAVEGEASEEDDARNGVARLGETGSGEIVVNEALREEAEALKTEYEAKAASIDKDREALLERARHEAEEIVAKARSDSEALIERRTRMAEDKIAAEERAAVEQLRAAAADAAAKATAKIIAERHDSATDAKLVDQAIKEIAGR